MNKVGILATLQARTGKEADVEQFLSSATPLVAAEVGTTAWFAIKIGPATLRVNENSAHHPTIKSCSVLIL